MIYPCKDCLILAVCNEDCDKLNDIDCYITHNAIICKFCGEKLNNKVLEGIACYCICNHCNTFNRQMETQIMSDISFKEVNI